MCFNFVCVCVCAHTKCGVFLTMVISSELSMSSKTVKMDYNLGPLFTGSGGTRSHGAWQLSENRRLPIQQRNQHTELKRNEVGALISPCLKSLPL